MDFAEIPFAVPAVGDVDGLLYQFGTYEFTGTPMFHFDLARQLAMLGPDEYVQVHLELLFESNDDLIALGRHGEWFWHGDAGVLTDWSQHIRRRPEWLVLRGRIPTDVLVYQDET